MHFTISSTILALLLATLLAPLIASAHANSKPKSHPDPAEIHIRKRTADDAGNPLLIAQSDHTRVKRDPDAEEAKSKDGWPSASEQTEKNKHKRRAENEVLSSGIQDGEKSLAKRDQEYDPTQPLPTSLFPPCRYDGIRKVCLDPCINDEGVCRMEGKHKMSWEQ
ncbi:MAG: hypothetical protein M1831_007519 [Alyxoria varia]|nr:MAG: hypothetical protein M1831_007519 [Alyxoria varia]